MRSQEAVRTGGSSLGPAGRAGPRPAGNRTLPRGETGHLTDGWARINESQPQGASGDCTCHRRSGREALELEGPDRVRRGEQPRMLRGQRYPELGCRGRGLPGVGRHAARGLGEAPGMGCTAGGTHWSGMLRDGESRRPPQPRTLQLAGELRAGLGHGGRCCCRCCRGAAAAAGEPRHMLDLAPVGPGR